MTVEYSNKEIKDYVYNRKDRKAVKTFCKSYCMEVAKKIVHIHDDLISSKSVYEYNTYHPGKNSIQPTQGQKNTDIKKFELRINYSWRKFLNFYCDYNNSKLLQVGEWKGQFNNIKAIKIIEINHHDFKRK
jgi:hypothetical protein